VDPVTVRLKADTTTDHDGSLKGGHYDNRNGPLEGGHCD
jgi:hypothetical protein